MATPRSPISPISPAQTLFAFPEKKSTYYHCQGSFIAVYVFLSEVIAGKVPSEQNLLTIEKVIFVSRRIIREYSIGPGQAAMGTAPVKLEISHFPYIDLKYFDEMYMDKLEALEFESGVQLLSYHSHLFDYSRFSNFSVTLKYYEDLIKKTIEDRF